MGRSIRKGPFVAYHLLKKIEVMNEASQKQVIKTWSRSSTITPQWLGIQLLSIMDANMFQFL